MKTIGHKENMTQVFDDQGRVFPVTVVGLEDKTEIEQFAENSAVRLSGTSKGKGFQGVVKRHGFHGGPRSHGQKHSEREPGSIGGGLRTRVPKGMRMAGRMGGDRVTIKDVKIIRIDKEEGKLYLSGAVPGRRGSRVELTTNSLKLEA